MTQRLIEEDKPEHDDEIVAGPLYLEDLDFQISQRQTETKVWNQPAQRVSRILRDLDNPATTFGQIDDDMKRAIRAMAKGRTQKKTAEEVGLSVGHLRKKLKALGSPREQSSIQGCADEGDNVVCIQAAADWRLSKLSKSLNTSEASEMLGVRPATLRGWKARRIGPPFLQLSPRCVRYAEDDILQYANERRVVPSVRETRETS